MRRPFIIFVTLILFVKCGQKNVSSIFIGTWESEPKNEFGLITFQENGYVIINSGQEIIGGESFLKDKEQLQMIYTFDIKSNPILLDFIIKEKGTEKEKGRIKGIVKIINDSQVIISLDPLQRPINFDEGLIFNKMD